MILPATFSAAVAMFRCCILMGEPLIFPTDTIYGMGAPLSAIAANKKIYMLKERPLDQPMPVLVANEAQLAGVIEPLTAEKQLWLDELKKDECCTTVIFEAADLPELYTSNGTVAIRMLPAGWLADAVAIIGAVTATSVNKSGMPPLNDIQSISAAFPDVNILNGHSSNAKPSRIIDITGSSPQLLRA